jgi:hypothetical protein
MECIKTHRLAVALAIAALFAGASVAASSETSARAGKTLSKKEVRALVANAKTPEDHLKLAQHFEAEAARMDAEAAEHEVLAKEYRRNPAPFAGKMPMSPRSAEHCDYFAKSAHDAARAARELAAEHREMAEEAK